MKVSQLLLNYRKDLLKQDITIEFRENNYALKDVIYRDVNELFKDACWDRDIEDWFVNWGTRSLVINLK